MELVDLWKWVGYCFWCYLRSLHDSLVTESGCSGNDGADKLFWGVNLSLLVILSANANANMLSASR